jgi:hypothetical protein
MPKGGRIEGTKNWSAIEDGLLFRHMRTHMPLGMDGWGPSDD